MNINSGERIDYHARILIVEDDREMCRFFSDLLTDEGYEVEVAYDGPSALERYRQAGFDITITDLMMPRMKGTELVRQLRKIDPGVLVLLITAFGSIESAVESMRAGAFNYLTKPFRTEELLLSVSRALEQRGLQKELQRLRREIHSRYGLGNLVGKSDKMQRVFDMVSHISDVPANILIVGESGTGKELVARSLHYHSTRSQGPFVPVNCAAIPEPLLESELFGYRRGAFTDAKNDRKGLFQEASRGSLFLDEISEIPVNLQAKLLRVIEDKEVRPLGALLARSRIEVSLEEALSKRYTLRDLEREYIKRVLESTSGNKTEAANILGVDRTTLYRRLEETKTKE